MTRSTGELERDVERTRSDIEHTVDALRDKMSIGQIVDEAAQYFRHSGGNEMVSNLAAQVRANPLPLALVGIGLAWLMSGRGQPSMGYATAGYASTGYDSPDTGLYGDSTSSGGIAARAGETAASAKDTLAESGRRVGEAAASAKDTMVESSRRAGEAVSSGIHRASGTASQAYGRISDQASRVHGQVQRSVSDIVESEPLILAGLGLAVGAAIGAMLPATETENRLLGEKRDSLKRGAEEMAREEWEKTKSVAKDAAAAAETEIRQGGLTSRSAERAVQSAARTAEESAREKKLGSSIRKAD